MFINTEKFALAVVASSDPKLSVQEKFKLYQDAYSYAQTENEKLNDKDDKKQVSVKETIATFKNLGL